MKINVTLAGIKLPFLSLKDISYPVIKYINGERLKRKELIVLKKLIFLLLPFLLLSGCSGFRKEVSVTGTAENAGSTEAGAPRALSNKQYGWGLKKM